MRVVLVELGRALLALGGFAAWSGLALLAGG
jgi:hypothetical protein